MALLRSASLLLALSSLAVAAPATGLKTSVIERLSGPPAGWKKDESTSLDKDATSIKLRINLVQQNMDKFHELAMNIATPDHPLYGNHLSQEVIDRMIAPKDESKEIVMQWLESADMDRFATVSPRLDAVIVEASVSKIETLLQAEYEPFVHTEDGDSLIRTLQYSLPDSLKAHVSMVQPTTFFGLRAMRSLVTNRRPFPETSLKSAEVEAVTGCTGSNINPKCLSNLYSFASAQAYSNGLMGIAGFLEQYAIKSDLATFMRSYATENNAAQSFTCTIVNGGSCPTSAASAGVEANLDVQYARAITENIPNTYYSVGGRPPIVGTGTNTNEPYLEFINYLLALPAASLPQTLSISYGDDEATVPLSYANNVCNLFAQLGAKGVSVLVASGDSGVGTTCTENNKPQFTTSFPAACPWVTTVGGTTGNSPEAAWSAGGGGFSSVFGRPSYQNATVNAWLASDKTHTSVASYFNSSGRAYPDISAQATNFVIVVSGSAEQVDGTSCATPTFASIIQLLNSDRLLNKKSPLGFLNPWLYSSASSGLTDITTGRIGGCSGRISGAGFSAVAGWDPATGLGTPNFSKLLPLVKALK